jgi:hypothetical protein
VVARWGGLGGGRFEMAGLEYVVWKLGNHGIKLDGIKLGRDEHEGTEQMVVRAGVDAATERNIGCRGSIG